VLSGWFSFVHLDGCVSLLRRSLTAQDKTEALFVSSFSVYQSSLSIMNPETKLIRARAPSFDNRENKSIVRRPSMGNHSPTTPPAIVQSSSNPEVFGNSPSSVTRRK